MNYCQTFKDKKITIMGLGILGRGVGVAKFLAECGAKLTVTDLKTKEQLRSSLAQLAKYKNIKYFLGGHRLADFQNKPPHSKCCKRKLKNKWHFEYGGKDMIIKAAGVPLDSPYIKEAKKNKIPVEMDASLFAKLSPAKIIGITGTRGKSTVTHLIYNALRGAGAKVFLSGNVKAVATLSLLKKIQSKLWCKDRPCTVVQGRSLHKQKETMVVMELDSWQLQGFGDSKISPHIAVFTNFMPDHLNYYRGSMKLYFKDKANIFKYQNENDFLIVGEQAAEAIKKFFKGKINPHTKIFGVGIKSKLIIARAGDIPENWKIKIPGRHNLENIALAMAALKTLGIEEKQIKNAVESFNGLPGRMEFVREIKGIKYYNDTNGTTPDAVIAGLEAMKKFKGKIILIGGGADKGLDYKKYAETVKNYVKALILFKGAASDKIAAAVGKNSKLDIVAGVANMKDAVRFATEKAGKGDIIILSPGAASFGIFQNEFDRGNQFIRILKSSKT